MIILLVITLKIIGIIIKLLGLTAVVIMVMIIGMVLIVHQYHGAWSRVLLEKLLVAQSRNSATFCRSRRFITVYTKAHHQLVCSEPYESNPPDQF
jgi:hypothetical protein